MSRSLRSVAFLIGATWTLASRIEAGDLSGVPAKIEIAATSLSGTHGTIKLALLDPANSPAPAKKDLKINIESKSETGEIGKSIVMIKQGHTEGIGTLPIKQSGIVEVTASNPELAQGGTVVDVLPNSGETTASPSPSAVPMTTVAPMATAEPMQPPPPPGRPGGATAATGRAFHSTSRTMMSGLTGSNVENRPGVGFGVHPSPAAAARIDRAPASVHDFEEAAEAPSPPPLKLRYYPVRKLRADERDPATVCATLPSNWPAPTDYSVYLMSDVGPLTPEPIRIAAGKVRGEGKLVATRPGTVQVWYEYSTPAATAPSEPLKIEFTHPVWAPKLVPTSPVVTLFDSVDVAVELVNYEGTSVPADDERKVDVRIGGGAGQLTPTEVKFAANDNRQMTTFIPIKPGKVQLIANSTYLPELPPAELTVVTPYGLLLFCGLGSFLGALLVYLTDKKSATWKRLVVGFITGYVLYWALLFGVVFIPNFPHASLLNPFTAVVLPLFGGWAGIKVITFIAKKLGFQF